MSFQKLLLPGLFALASSTALAATPLAIEGIPAFGKQGPAASEVRAPRTVTPRVETDDEVDDVEADEVDDDAPEPDRAQRGRSADAFGQQVKAMTHGGLRGRELADAVHAAKGHAKNK